MSTLPPSAANAAALERAYQHCRMPPGDTERILLAERLARARHTGVDWLNLAFEHFSGFDFIAAHAALDEAIRRAPDLLPARWLKFQLPLHPAPENEQEAQAYVGRWSEGLGWFESLDLDQPGMADRLATCIASHTAFYRHYLGDDCRVEQERYGRLCSAVMARLVPPAPLTSQAPRPRRRVLFCTSFLYQHTVARLFLPLIEQLDPGLFDVHLFQLGRESDAVTDRAARAATLHRGPRPPQHWVQLARALACDAVVYLDVGMDPTTQVLAATRLAPRQAMLWGHPVTSGLPTLDALLSADAIEPADAQGHYSELLVRLPGLGHGLAGSPGAKVPQAPERRGQDGPIRLFCAQSIYKLQPRFDRLLARILATLPEAELHLVPHSAAPVRAWLGTRLANSCRLAGVDSTDRIHMHGYQSLEGFLALASSCDINLDTPSWSGGMSSIDLLGLGLPTVTLEGSLMRSRQTAALLRRCGQPELICRDDDAYVQQVLALAPQRETLGARRAALATASAGIDDSGPVANALADWLQHGHA